MTSSNQIPAAENQNFVTIPREEYPRIIWKLQRVKSVIDFLHEKLIDLQQDTNHVVLPSTEACDFCDVLHDDAFVGLNEVSDQLIESGVDGFQQIGHKLRDISNHAGVVLNFLMPNLPEAPVADHVLGHRGIYMGEVDSIFLLIDEIWHGLPVCIDGLKNFIANDSKKRSHKKGSYETVMTERIKAIRPKFKALYDKYIFPGGSELLTGPKGVRKETKNLRHEINELQNQMPVESEEAMDCRLAIDHLDFLIRLIDSKFDFRNSDLITLSLVVDQASAVFSQSLSWLTPDDGGGLVKDPLH